MPDFESYMIQAEIRRAALSGLAASGILKDISSNPQVTFISLYAVSMRTQKVLLSSTMSYTRMV